MKLKGIAILFLVVAILALWCGPAWTIGSKLSGLTIVPGSFYVKTSGGTERAYIGADGALRLNTNKFTVSTGGNGAFAGNLTVTGNLTLGGTWNLNSGIAVDTDHFVVNGTTGLTTIKPTTTTTQALKVDGASITTGDVLQLRGTSTMGTDGYYLRVLEDATEVFSIKRSGANTTLTTCTGTFATTGAATLASLTCTAAGTFGGGYGSTGATIATTGNIQTNGTLTVDGATTLTGATTQTGALAANGGITCDTNKFVVADTSGNVTMAGTLTGGAGTDIAINTDKFTVAAATGNTVIGGTSTLTGAVTIGNGYAGTGASIGATGAVQTKGALTVDGASTLTGAVACGSTIAGPAEGKVVVNTYHRVTTAEVNAGHTLVTAVAGRQFRLVGCKATPYGGAATGATSVDILCNSNKLVAFTIGDGWPQSYPLQDGLTHKSQTSTGAVLADGASYIAQTANQAVTIGKTGSNLATCTGIDIVLSYVLE